MCDDDAPATTCRALRAADHRLQLRRGECRAERLVEVPAVIGSVDAERGGDLLDLVDIGDLLVVSEDGPPDDEVHALPFLLVAAGLVAERGPQCRGDQQPIPVVNPRPVVLEEAYGTLPGELKIDTLVFLTVTDGEDEFLY